MISMIPYILVVGLFTLTSSIHLQIQQPLHQAYKDNLLVQNWYYGDLDPVGYRVRIFETAATEITKPCPVDTPFATKQMNDCEQCPQERPLRNLGSYQCESCPQGEQFDTEKGNCTTLTDKQSSTQQSQSITVVPSNQQAQTNNQPQNQQTAQQVSDNKVIEERQNEGVIDMNPDNVTEIYEETIQQQEGGQNETIQESGENKSGSIGQQNQTTSESEDLEGSTAQTSIENQTSDTLTSNTTETAANNTEATEATANNTEATANITEATANSTEAQNATEATANSTKAQNATQTTVNNTEATAQNATESQIQNTTSINSENQQNQKIICPDEAPLWDPVEQICTQCDQNSKFIVQQSKCSPYIYLFNENASNIIQSKKNQVKELNDQASQNSRQQLVQNCSEDQPYVGIDEQGNMYCLACNLSQYFDVNHRECVEGCKQSLVYSSLRQMCVEKGQQNITQQQEQKEQQQQYIPISSLQIPMDNLIGTKTHNCSRFLPYFNETTKQCQTCPKHTQYNSASDKCLPFVFVPNQDGEKLIMPDPGYWEQYRQYMQNHHPDQKIVECHLHQPYVRNSECVVCPEQMPFYTIVNQQCIERCPLGTIYDSDSKICKNGQYLVNPEATGLYFKTQERYKSWQQNNELEKQRNPESEYCPIEKPYLKHGQCFNCQGQFPLYDVEMDKCTECGKGRSYNEQSRTCTAYGSYDSSSLERMIANIF